MAGRSSHEDTEDPLSLPKVLVYPGAFNMTTGPAHYQVLARARAVDTQSYATCRMKWDWKPASWERFHRNWYCLMVQGAKDLDKTN